MVIVFTDTNSRRVEENETQKATAFLSEAS